MASKRITRKMKIKFARHMRKNPTKAEQHLGEILLRDFGGVRWFAQYIICGWIADFYSPEVGLIVEVDGSSHKGQEGRDAFRDATIYKKMKVTTLRVTNAEVLKNRPRALGKISAALNELRGQSLP